MMAAFGLVLASMLWGGTPAPGAQDPELQRFERLYAQKIGELEKAQARQRAADVAYQKMRHRRNERGATKAAIVAERQAATVELEEAEKSLADFEKKSRLGGVPPGWFRERPAPRMDAPPASP
jgi:hypothetical protein